MNDFFDLIGPEPELVLFIAVAILVIVILIKGIRIVPEGRAKIVERLGRRHKTIFAGINIIIPFLDRVKNINERVTTKVKGSSESLIDRGSVILAEQRMDPDGKKLLAKDNSEIFVDPIVYFRVTDPARLIYDVTNFEDSFETLIETALRQEVGKYDGDTIVTSRDTLGDALKQTLLNASVSWGIEIRRVEIEELSFPEEVTQSLSDARQEELKRRAELVAQKAEAEQLTLAADAKKKAAVLEAEGVKEAAILKAQGEFEAQKLEAEARFLLQSREQEGIAQGYAAISRALKENPEAIVALEALKAQAKIADSIGNSNNALIVPSDTAGLFGAFASLAKGYEALKPGPSSSVQNPEVK
jgi:regulator of protease activity HflC (stomatin/prohibitin superfamily)